MPELVLHWSHLPSWTDTTWKGETLSLSPLSPKATVNSYSAASSFTILTYKHYYPDPQNLLPGASPFLGTADLWVHYT